MVRVEVRAIAISAVLIRRHSLLRVVVAGAALAMLATALAAVIFSVVEFREFHFGVILFAPVLQSAVIGALAVAGFRLVGTRVRGLPFVALAAVCGCLLGATVGALFVGHSPHFSHDKAVVILALSWCFITLVTALSIRVVV